MRQLDIIFPVYNEKDIIGKVLEEWKRNLGDKLSYSFIVCEDGSTDGTKQILKNLQKKFPIILNQKTYRRGYGQAVLDGMRSSQAEYILCVDSDGQCDPSDIFNFWQNRKKANVIIGWRKNRSDSTHRKLFSFLFGCVFRILFPNNIHDPSVPYVLFQKKTVLPYLRYLGFLKEGFWWGFIGMCTKNNISVFEVPIHHRKRFIGETHVYKIGKLPTIVLRNLFGLWLLRIAK